MIFVIIPAIQRKCGSGMTAGGRKSGARGLRGRRDYAVSEGNSRMAGKAGKDIEQYLCVLRLFQKIGKCGIIYHGEQLL